MRPRPLFSMLPDIPFSQSPHLRGGGDGINDDHDGDLVPNRSLSGEEREA